MSPMWKFRASQTRAGSNGRLMPYLLLHRVLFYFFANLHTSRSHFLLTLCTPTFEFTLPQATKHFILSTLNLLS